MNTSELIVQLEAAGVQLWLDGDTVRFRAPRGALTAELRERLQSRKDAIRDLLRHAATPGSSGSAAPIPRAPREGALPLSFAQQRLWFLTELDPGNPSYNIPAALRLDGPLDVAALERSVCEIVRRHEALRTTFPAANGEPRQVIAPEPRLRMEVIDLGSLAAEVQEREVRRLAAEEAARPFDLAEGPLLRAALLRLGEWAHVLLLTMHHIVSDGWSTGVAVRELGALYAAFSASLPSPLGELPIQYADFAVWQRQWLSGEVLERQIAFWRARLSGVPALELPTDRPRLARSTHRGAHHELVLPAELGAALRRLGQAHGATLFMTVLGAFQILLGRWSGQDDFCVGTPIVNRRRAELEPLIGLFLNTLALRAALSGNPTFSELLARVRTASVDAYAHQDLPFERLVDLLATDRDASRHPIFQVFFNATNFPMEEVTLSGLTVAPLASPEIGAKFDLTLYMDDRQDQIRLTLVYDGELFDAERTAEFLAQLELLLRRVVERPDLPVGHHSLVTSRARAVLPDPVQPIEVSWDGAVHDRFARSARRWPDRAALEDGLGAWTYRELHERTNRLANHLRDRGVRPGGCVGVYGHRSAALVVALLGILKAGAAFVILDPAQPAERLAGRLGAVDLQAWIALAEAGPVPVEIERVIAAASCVCRITLQQDRAAHDPWMAGAAEDTGVIVGPEDLAYVAFTSGTTGAPKAILGPHRPLSHFLSWHIGAFQLGEDDRFSMLSGLGHDPLLRDVFTPLCLGATLCIPDPEPRALGEWMARCRVSVVHTTPAIGQILAATAGGGALASLRHAFFGGDTLTRADVGNLRRVAPSVQCVNFYGTTETPQAMGHFVVPATCATDREDESRAPVPVGRGIEGVQLLVLNAEHRLAGMGELGEIHVRTPYLASGYLGDEALSAARFVANPFTGEPADRLYRTGDLGRYALDGNVCFCGRRDQQVKIRGFRVELGEVEEALGRHPAVARSVLVTHEDAATGDRRLVAYVVAREGAAAPDASELRAHLQGKLPDYMVPSAFVALEALPLTPNGKIDRRALPAPDLAKPKQTYVPPRTPTEEAVAALWAEILRVERVGGDDHFFELGGHSLLATQVISRLRSTFGIDLPLRTLFEAPTLRALAERVDAAKRDASPCAAPPIVPVPRDGDLPLSFAQQRLWFLAELAPDNPFYNLPVALRLDGPLDVAALAQSLSTIVSRHEALRTTFPAVEGTPRQVIAPAAPLPLPVVDLAHREGEAQQNEVRRLAAEEAARPFDLTKGPLLRAALLRLGERAHVLLLTMHHIVSDGWSMGVAVRELGTLYAAFSAGLPSPLGELPIQYADFAAWQRQWLSGEVLETQLGYWKKQLAGAPPALELPTDRPRPPVQSFRGGACAVALPRELSAALVALSQREGVTLFMTLLAAFQVLLSRYTGQEDLIVGSPIANRTRAETEGLIGFFVNTLALRTDLSGAPSFRQLLGRVREGTLGAYAHQDLPFEKLVEELSPVRDLSRSPLFQAMFVLQNTPAPTLALTELTLSRIEVENTTVKCDLMLGLSESEGGLLGTLGYDTDLFEASTIARMLNHFQVLLEGIVANPDRSVAELPLLTAEEQRRLLVGWSATAQEFPTACIHTLFEAQVDKTPEAVAVVFEDQRLTYRELDCRANQLAHHLRSLGIGSDSLVGLSVQRSLDMVVGILGILKAGGAYLPLDPEYPRDRLAFMIEDSRIPVVVTHSQYEHVLPSHAARVVRVDTDAETLASQPATRPEVDVSPEHLAYCIYTSGSTGKPKGALVTHENVVRLFSATEHWYHFDDRDVWTLFHSYAFDFSVWELWGALFYGGRVVVVPYWVSRAPDAFYKLLGDEGVTVLNQTPSAFRQLLHAESEAGEEALRRLKLRYVIFGGEALDLGDLRPWWARHGDAQPQLVNMYGITETTVHVTYRPVSTKDMERPWSSVIGCPIPDLQVYVLDAHRQLAPIGVPGEMYVGGAGVARGYLRRPELTAERFLDDPFRPGAGHKLYKTGDLARILANGDIEYLGRIDHQVKIRGFRIELGEIESVLREQPSVREVTVLVREDVPGDKRLVAYLVAGEGGVAPSTNDLRGYLQTKLPDYMVPSAFVWLSALPLSPNGKVDRRALPTPNERSVERSERFLAPRDVLEFQLAQIWESLLGAGPVGVRDDFFALGGNSFLAIQLIARIKERLGRRLPLTVLFRERTIETMAETLRSNAEVRPWSPLIPIQPAGRGHPLFCVRALGGGVMHFAALARALGRERPIYGLEARGLEEGQEPDTRVEDIASDYVEALRAVQPKGPYLLCGLSAGGVIAFEMAQQLVKEGNRVGLLALLDTRAPGLDPGGSLEDAEMHQIAGFILKWGLDTSVDELRPLAPDDRLRVLVERMHGKGHLPRSFGVKEARRLVAVNRADHQALRCYSPPVYPGKITLFRTSERLHDAERIHLDNPTLGWSDLSARPVDVLDVSGNHWSFVEEPHVAVLADRLKRCLLDDSPL